MKTKATFSKVLAWTLMFAMVLGMTPAAVANIDEYENSLFSEIRFTNPLNGLSFKATGDFEVGASRQGAAMTPESELGFVITRDRADAYSVEYDDSMVSYITAYSETPMQTLSFVFSESLTDVAYQKDGSAFESLAKWDGSSPAPSLYYTEILSADSLTYSINFVGFYDADFPKGYDGITFQFTTDSGTFTVALTAQAAETFTVAFDLSELAVATNNTSGDGWSILYNNIIITESTLPVTLHGDSGGRSVRIENATDITLAEGTIISSNTSAEPALRINGAATIHGEGAGIEISSNDNDGISASGNLEITGTIKSISGSMDGDMYSGIASSGDLTINGTIDSISGGKNSIITRDFDLLISSGIGTIEGGISANGDITISGDIGSINAGISTGITAMGGDITISGTIGNISSGTSGIFADNGVTINGTVGDIVSEYPGIATYGSVTIGANAVVGNISSTASYGIDASLDVIISGRVGVISGGNGRDGLAPERFLIINNNSVVYTSSVYPTATISNTSQGILFIGDEGAVYGDVTLKANLTLTPEQTLTVPAGARLTVPAGKTLISSGTVSNSGTLTNNGTVSSSGALTNNGRIVSREGGIAGRISGNAVEYLYEPVYVPPLPSPPPPEPLQAVHEFEHGTVTLSEETLAMLAELGGEVRVALELVPLSELTGVLAARVKGYGTVVSIDVFVDGEKVDVPLTVSLPYTLKDGEIAAGVNVWHLAGSGKLTNLNGVYDADTRLITFEIARQSYFVIGCDEALAAWDGLWTDVDGSEYFDAIAFIAWYVTELDETLFAGTGGGLFAPDRMMTRGQFMTVLHKLAGRPAHSGGAGFDDVDAGAWYSDAALWSCEAGIAEGVGGNLFAPELELSREQMAVALSKYAAYAGIALEPLRELPEELEFSGWADEDGHITALAGAGLLTSGGLDLTQGAPRAEIALMFAEFVRLTGEVW